jgi:hypothetical protein
VNDHLSTGVNVLDTKWEMFVNMVGFLSRYILVPVFEIADLTGAITCLEGGAVFRFSTGFVTSM